MRNFQRKRERGEIDPYGDLEEGIHPDWTQVRVLCGSRMAPGCEAAWHVAVKQSGAWL